MLWTIKEPTTNPWFVGMFNSRQGVFGVLASGKLYTHASGKNDLGAIPILEHWDMPDWDGGAPDLKKGYRRVTVESLPKGNWDVTASHYLDRDSAATGTGWSWTQIPSGAATYDDAVYDTATYVSGGTVQGGAWVDLVGRTMRTRLENQNTSEDWVLAAISLEYVVYPRRSV
jgi:hypothetical protein